MRTLRPHLPLVPLVAVLIVLAGCGAVQTSADKPLTTGDLTPNIEDKDAGLVAVAPGFDITKYKTVVVEKLSVAADQIDDEGDRRFADAMTSGLQQQLVRRLQESGLFQQVVAGTAADATSSGSPALVLRGTVTRLGRGSQAARYFAGIYGAGKARAEADMALVEAPSGRVVVATADRRVSHSFQFFGGDSEDILKEGFSNMARDYAKFLLRLSKGEAPGK